MAFCGRCSGQGGYAGSMGAIAPPRAVAAVEEDDPSLLELLVQ